MKQPLKKLGGLGLILAGLLGLNACSDLSGSADEMGMETPAQGPNQVFWGLTFDNRLVQMNSLNIANVGATLAISNTGGDPIVSIDYRPATGQLYGLGASSRLYTINTNSGRAQALGTTTFSPALNGSVAMIDFNPVVDRIRLVTSSGQNLRLHPELGTVVATDANITGGSSPSIVGIAYTNSVAGTTGTTLYDVDASSGRLFIQDPPNDGRLAEVGASNFGYEGPVGFDISPNNSVALLSITRNGRTSIATLNLSSGKESYLGQTSVALRDLAIPTNQVIYAVDNANNLHSLTTGFSLNTRAVTGLQAGETLLGIDFRPINGQLYALGSSSRIYTINLGTAAATAVGPVLTTALAGTRFGFDFNPTVDRLRIVSNTGQNLRYNPNDNAVVLDGALNPGSPAATAVAYTNNFPGATSTSMLVLNASTLFSASNPNAGTLTPVGTLNLTNDADNGFDIGGQSNMGWFVSSTGTSTATLYSLNLANGQAAPIATLPARITGFAVGLGF